VEGPFNAIQLDAEPVGRVLLEGRGAGGGPTASAVVADLVALARGDRFAPFTCRAEALRPVEPIPGGNPIPARYYLRLCVTDAPGVLADITRLFAQHGISLETVLQQVEPAQARAQLMLTTHETSEGPLQAALTAIAGLPSLHAAPVLLPIYPDSLP
jgi:homoserine dehydrogenase